MIMPHGCVPTKTLSLLGPGLKTRGVAAGTHFGLKHVVARERAALFTDLPQMRVELSWGQLAEYQSMRLSVLSTAVAARAGVLCCVLLMLTGAQALAQTSATDNPGPTAAQPSVPAQEKPAAAAEEKPPAADDKPATVEQKPAPSEEKPAIAQDKPAAVEEKPAATDDKPAIVEQKPAPAEEKPAVAQDKPAAVEEKPACRGRQACHRRAEAGSCRGKTSGCAGQARSS